MHLKTRITLGITLLINATFAQSLTQTVRGNVTEIGSGVPINHVKIVLLNATNNSFVYSDSLGYFRFDSVPIGRQSFGFYHENYAEKAIQHMDVNSGKELVLNIGLEERFISIKEAQIRAVKDPKEKPLNGMATVSARQFSVEETQRFAAAVNDPARMAMGFAGVMAPDDGNNMIVIRGNAPNGLIWRMEGMDIPNPNHFSNVGTSGGGITILSAQVLSNSDFFTGAFPAEYGNGLSGVFDLKLRKGNNEKREHTVQFGLLGLDLAAEGPLGKNGGSYLINYRYSTLSMISALGIELGDATTKFQDLSYNIHLPIHKKSAISIFGFTGLSNQFAFAELDSLKWKENPDKAYEWEFTANSIFNGAKYATQLSKKHQFEIKTGVGITQHGYAEKKYETDYLGKIHSDITYKQIRLTTSAQSNYKLSSKALLRSGIIANIQQFNFDNSELNSEGNLQHFLSVKGNTPVLQAYTQMQYRATPRWTLNPGIHAIWLGINRSYSIEPRLGMKYQLGKKSWLSAGYGRHAQVQPIGTYYFKNTDGHMPNKGMKMSFANHFILGYDRMMGKSWHVKTEGYLQLLGNVPVSPKTGSTYSMLNSMDGFYFDTLLSIGKGKNIGAEITLEKFFTGSYYLMATSSISNSTYTDANGNEFSTRFNIGHTFSLLAGKEWNIKGNRLGLNIKALWNGGLRDNPIDFEASKIAKTTVRDYTKTYTWQNPDYLRVDTKISYKINKKKHSITWSLDIQNTTNHQNVWGSYYDVQNGKIAYSKQAPLIPILAYKIEF